MKYAKILSLQQFGTNICPVEVECQQSVHLPSFHILGCSSAHSRALRERVFSALESSGFKVPARKITVQIVPDCLREGSQSLDLAVALAILSSESLIPEPRLRKVAVLGGLRLDGSLVSVGESSALPSFLAKKQFRSAILPFGDSHVLAGENLDDGGGFHCLQEVVDFLRRRIGRGRRFDEILPKQVKEGDGSLRIEQIHGQASVKHMLLLAAAGAHHSLLYGPRGTGKSFLASALPGILPLISKEERQEIQTIYSLSGELWDGQRPFRSPHASISRGNLIGGLGKNKFGEISLAHGGVLFLDEVLEMDRHVLESLRTPIENGEICLRRGDMMFRLPCRTTLFAAANLCPCGLLGDSRHHCECTRSEIRHYRRRISAALLDRMDILHTVRPEGDQEKSKATTEEYRALAASARERMNIRQGKANALLRGEEIFAQKPWSAAANALWSESCRERGFSHRAAAALARVALTISDVREGATVNEEDLLQSLFYRSELT